MYYILGVQIYSVLDLKNAFFVSGKRKQMGCTSKENLGEIIPITGVSCVSIVA